MWKHSVRFLIVSVILFFFLFDDGHCALADALRLASCLTNLTSESGTPPSIESPATLASQIMGQLNRPQTVEIVINYNKQGQIVKQETNNLPTLDAGQPLLTADEQRQIIKSISDAISDNEFSSLPLRRQQEILIEIQNEIKGFPASVEGETLAEADLKIKLNHLSLNLRHMKKVPVIFVENPDLIAKQLSSLIDIITDDTLWRCGEPLSLDLNFRNSVVESLEDRFSAFAQDTTDPSFKIALPTSQYQTLVTNLHTLLNSGSPPNFDFILGKTNRQQRIGKNAEDKNWIASSFAATEFTYVISLVVNSYVMYALSNDLAKIDFSGGISEAERLNDGKEMQAYTEREFERIKLSQAEQMKKFQMDFAKNHPGSLPTRTRPSAISNRVRITAAIAFVFLNILVIALLIRFRREIK